MILRNIYDVYTIFSQFNAKSQIYIGSQGKVVNKPLTHKFLFVI